MVNFVPEVIIPENSRLDNKIYTGFDFLDQWAPQYIVVSLIDREMKDRFVYRNKNLKTKTSIQTVFFEKGEYLLSAIYLK